MIHNEIVGYLMNTILENVIPVDLQENLILKKKRNKINTVGFVGACYPSRVNEIDTRVNKRLIEVNG